MTDRAPTEARLRRSLDAMRREVMDAVKPPSVKDSFEDTIQSAMARLKRLLGFG